MIERYYSGMHLEKDLKFCEIVDDLRRHPDVLIIKEPSRALVHEQERDPKNASRWRRTGKTHVGYDLHYVTFAYRQMIISVHASSHYPFTDDNEPGMFNFMVFGRIGKTTMKQLTYYRSYDGLESVDEWFCSKARGRGGFVRKGAQTRLIHIGINKGDEKKINNIVSLKGGYRETEIWRDGAPVILKTDTWNDHHKVVDIIRTNKWDSTGHRDSFSVDLVSRTICG